MRYRFTRLWAGILIWVGLVLVGLGVVLALATLAFETPWKTVTSGPAIVDRLLVALFLILSSVLAGGPLIVFGQLLLIFLDQRRALVRIAHRLRRWEHRIDGDPNGPAALPARLRTGPR
jgi:hypothetical protein